MFPFLTTSSSASTKHLLGDRNPIHRDQGSLTKCLDEHQTGGRNHSRVEPKLPSKIINSVPECECAKCREMVSETSRASQTFEEQ
jgi:hypothetical protein